MTLNLIQDYIFFSKEKEKTISSFKGWLEYVDNEESLNALELIHNYTSFTPNTPLTMLQHSLLILVGRTL